MRPTHDEFGRALGRHHSTFWEWFPVNKPLKRTKDGDLVYDEFGYPRYRRVEYRYIDGVRGRLVPLTYGQGKRGDEGPRGGKAWQHYWMRLYVLDDGTIVRYRHEMVDRDESTGEFTYYDHWEPYTGNVWGIDGYERHIYVAYGRVVEETTSLVMEPTFG